MKGRKPKPDILKILQGTARKDRMKNKGQNVKLKIPKRPSFLYGEGKKEWGRASQELFNLGLLTELDMAALAGYCQSYHHWIEAEKKIEKEGLIITVIDSQGSKQLRLSPYLKIADKFMAQMKSFLVEFGMTPSSRSRVSISGPKDEDNPFDNI